MDSKWELIMIEMEDMWHESTEYKFLPLNIPKEDYDRIRDEYKAERIYDMYGYNYYNRFIQSCPKTLKSFKLIPCERNAQCTFLCHNYDKERGCTLDAAK